MGKNEMLVVGVMSGTSGDGVDVALARVTGGEASARQEHLWRKPDRSKDRPLRAAGRVAGELLAHGTFAMEPRVRAEILRVAEGGPVTAGEISQLNFRMGEVIAETVIAACRKFRVPISRVELIGSHGQTIFHQGKAVAFLGRYTASTLQIGEGAVIAARTGANTVSDFRTADMAVGGQGAPLVPFVDRILFGEARIGRVALNLGGIGNLTVLGSAKGGVFLNTEGTENRRSGGRGGRSTPRAQSRVTVPRGLPVAFDTGPGNMVIDALVAHFTKGRKRFDEDGRIARQGVGNERLMEEMMKDPYLKLRPPKSTGREYYGREYVERLLKMGKRFGASADDLVRAATIFTALTVVDAMKRFVLPHVAIQEVIVSGGGAHNPVIMAQLAAALAPIVVMPSSELGVDVDAKEAFAFALLAYETWHRRVGNLPEATGARYEAVLGKISFAAGEK